MSLCVVCMVLITADVPGLNINWPLAMREGQWQCVRLVVSHICDGYLNHTAGSNPRPARTQSEAITDILEFLNAAFSPVTLFIEPCFG